jgi:hypothetical protein
MLIPPQAAFVLATALAAVEPVSIPHQGGRETFADPVYDTGDARIGGSAGVADAALAPASSTAALDFRANLDTALSPDLSSYRYVHFAAHGLLNDARPELSGMVLSLVDRDGHARPGLLTAPDGAPRAVASLWPVDDLASSELMTRMSREMLGAFHLQGDWR